MANRHKKLSSRITVKVRPEKEHFVDRTAKILDELDVFTPKIVTLCGSMKFLDVMLHTYTELSKRGFLVFFPGLYSFYATPPTNAGIALVKGNAVPSLELAETRRKLHQAKMLMSDSVLIVNKNGYVGEDTQLEIDFAIANSIPVEYLFEEKETST